MLPSLQKPVHSGCRNVEKGQAFWPRGNGCSRCSSTLYSQAQQDGKMYTHCRWVSGQDLEFDGHCDHSPLLTLSTQLTLLLLLTHLGQVSEHDTEFHGHT
eukprot:99025-Pelagomonas_calceolata.AAC.1